MVGPSIARSHIALRDNTGPCPVYPHLEVPAKLGAGRVRDDIKIALKANLDFVELDGMQGSTGAGGTEVMEYVGIPTIASIQEAIDALEEIGRSGEMQIVLMGGLRDGIDGVKALCLGADAVAFGSSTIIAGGYIACMQCSHYLSQVEEARVGLSTDTLERGMMVQVELERVAA